MELRTMTRDEIGAFFEAAAKVETALQELTCRVAAPGLMALSEMREIVGEQLPGGYHGTCIGCEEVKGEDEMVNCGDEDLCHTCSDGLSKEPAEERTVD